VGGDDGWEGGDCRGGGVDDFEEATFVALFLRRIVCKVGDCELGCGKEQGL
jgi:hypothetical protein